MKTQKSNKTANRNRGRNRNINRNRNISTNTNLFVPVVDMKIVCLTALIVSGLLFADELENVLIGVCNDIMNMILPIAFLLVATAAVAYALGGIMSAEMRARTHVWAQSLLIGAIVGGIIYIIMPAILGALISAGLGSTDCSDIRSTICDMSGTCADIICRSLTC